MNKYNFILNALEFFELNLAFFGHQMLIVFDQIDEARKSIGVV